MKAKEDTEEITAEQYNHILLNRRPYFFKYLYRESKKEYNDYNEKQEILCIKLFGKPLDTVLHSLNKTEEEQQFVNSYYEWCPLIISDSCMNLLCRYIESIDFDIKEKIKTTSNFTKYSLYKSSGVKYSEKEKSLALKALQEYKQLKAKEQISRSNISYHSPDKLVENELTVNLQEIALKYISNIDILTNIYVDYFYQENPKSNKDILWRFFGKNMCDNLLKKSSGFIEFPIRDSTGDINYLGETYQTKEIDLFEQDFRER